MSDVILVNNLKKSYVKHTVLKGVTFSVRKGEIFALLGSNGAGKTTSLECLEGLKAYDGGSIEKHGTTGIQLQSSSLPAHIKPCEAIRLFAKWKHAPVTEQLLTSLGIHEFSKKQYRQLSTGQKRRLHLALALIGDPDLLFLDEPTAGLDVEAKNALHDQIRSLKKQGKTILLASHDMAEVEQLCDRIAILHGGKIAFCGTIGELNRQIGTHCQILIQTQNGMETYESENLGETLLSLLTGYQRDGIAVLDLEVKKASLEDQFLKIAKEGIL